MSNNQNGSFIDKLKPDDFVIITFSLPSEFKKDNLNNKSLFVKKRMSISKMFNLRGVRLGTSLYALKVVDIPDIEDSLKRVYDGFEYEFRILGKMNNDVLISTVGEMLISLTGELGSFFRIFDKSDKNAKEKLKKLKPTLNIAMNRLMDYEKLTRKEFKHRGIIFEAMMKRTKFMNEL